MKKVALMFGSVVVAGGLLVGCGASSDVNTGASYNVTAPQQKQEPPKQDDGTKKFNAGVSKTVLGLKVSIADVKISPDKVEIGVNVQNTSSKKLSFFPDQGNIVVGDMQIDANMFMGSGDVSGDIEGGVKKDGVIVYPVPDGKKIDVSKVKSIKVNFGDVTTADFMDSKPVTFEIPVK